MTSSLNWTNPAVSVTSKAESSSDSAEGRSWSKFAFPDPDIGDNDTGTPGDSNKLLTTLIPIFAVLVCASLVGFLIWLKRRRQVGRKTGDSPTCNNNNNSLELEGRRGRGYFEHSSSRSSTVLVVHHETQPLTQEADQIAEEEESSMSTEMRIEGNCANDRLESRSVSTSGDREDDDMEVVENEGDDNMVEDSDSMGHNVQRPNTLNFFTSSARNLNLTRLRGGNDLPFTPDPDFGSFPTPAPGSPSDHRHRLRFEKSDLLTPLTNRSSHFCNNNSASTTFDPASGTSGSTTFGLRGNNWNNHHNNMVRPPRGGLLERRGSSVHLTISLNQQQQQQQRNNELPPSHPRSPTSLHHLRTASRPLSPNSLHITSCTTALLSTEFWDIPMNQPIESQFLIAGYGTKNRYRSILPNLHSRVILKKEERCEEEISPNSECGDSLATYINANYIRPLSPTSKEVDPRTPNPIVTMQDAAYIATQGPLANTINDFWKMVSENNCHAIVMITKMKEKKEFKEKCCQYFPQLIGEIMTCGKLQVTVENVNKCDNYVIRTFELKNLRNDETRRVNHYWYTTWLDHQAPEKSRGLLELIQQVFQWEKEPHGPVVVHCSAGIGRTGCFIAVSMGCRELVKCGKVDILKIVSQMRLDRGGLVQTSDQYTFVHQALSRYARVLAGENVMTPSTAGSSVIHKSPTTTAHQHPPPHSTSSFDYTASSGNSGGGGFRRWKRSFSASNLPISTAMMALNQRQPRSPPSGNDDERESGGEQDSPTTLEALARVCLRSKDFHQTPTASQAGNPPNYNPSSHLHKSKSPAASSAAAAVVVAEDSGGGPQRMTTSPGSLPHFAFPTSAI